MRLQDLTAKDIETYIRDELRQYLIHNIVSSGDEVGVSRIAGSMIEKTEGVFLWVHYALKSVVRGVEGYDDLEELYDRIGELLKGMYQLYLQMWERLNGDNQRYHDEAATYFWYAASVNNRDPLSVFDMWVSLNQEIQKQYLIELAPFDPNNLIKSCERLEKRIITRCAGVLEICCEGDSNNDSMTSTHSYDIDRSTLPHESNPRNGKRMVPIMPSFFSNSHIYLQKVTFDSSTASHQHSKKIKFLHRTAYDFLCHTHEGQEILSKLKTPVSERWENIAKAKMARMIEGVEGYDPDPYSIDNMIHSISRYNESRQVELLITLRQVCEAVSLREFPDRSYDDGRFWPNDDKVYFEGLAASNACTGYIQHVVQNCKTTISSSHFGYLLLCVLTCCRFRPAKSLPLAIWLTSQGADLTTKQHVFHESYSYSSIEQFLVSGIRWKWNLRHRPTNSVISVHSDEYDDPQVQKQVAELLELFSSSSNDSASQSIVTLSRQRDWTFDFLELTKELKFDPGIKGYDISVSISLSQLYHLAMMSYRKHVPRDQLAM